MTATIADETETAEVNTVCRETWLADMYTADPDEDGTDWEYDDDRRRDVWHAGYDDGRAGHPPACHLDVYTHGYDIGGLDLLAVETAALADPTAWMTLPQWDVLGAIGGLPGVEWDAGRQHLWVPLIPLEAECFLTCAECRLPGLFETAFARGTWLDLTTLGGDA